MQQVEATYDVLSFETLPRYMKNKYKHKALTPICSTYAYDTPKKTEKHASSNRRISNK